MFIYTVYNPIMLQYVLQPTLQELLYNTTWTNTPGEQKTVYIICLCMCLYACWYAIYKKNICVAHSFFQDLMK